MICDEADEDIREISFGIEVVQFAGLNEPIVHDLKAWFETKLTMVSQKSTIAEAIRYALSRWEGLCRFIEDGRIEIDSNVVERTIRPLALNRKRTPCSPAPRRLRRFSTAGDHDRHKLRQPGTIRASRVCFTTPRPRLIPCRRAISLTRAPGKIASATIAAFSSELHRRRRSGPERTSTAITARP
jgi:hypothetical protein